MLKMCILTSGIRADPVAMYTLAVGNGFHCVLWMRSTCMEVTALVTWFPIQYGGDIWPLQTFSAISKK